MVKATEIIKIVLLNEIKVLLNEINKRKFNKKKIMKSLSLKNVKKRIIVNNYYLKY